MIEISGASGLWYVAAGAAIMWLVQAFLKRTLGTKYLTENQCENCSVRASMEIIKTLVVELAIKAGVPPHEVAKVVSHIGKTGDCK